MTSFGSFLGQIIAADFDGRRLAFARASDVAPASVSNYLNSDELPSHENLKKILGAVKDPFKQRELFSAFISDIGERVHVSQDAARGVVTDKLSPVDQEIAKIVATLSKRARRSPKFLQILRDIAQWPE